MRIFLCPTDHECLQLFSSQDQRASYPHLVARSPGRVDWHSKFWNWPMHGGRSGLGNWDKQLQQMIDFFFKVASDYCNRHHSPQYIAMLKVTFAKGCMLLRTDFWLFLKLLTSSWYLWRCAVAFFSWFSWSTSALLVSLAVLFRRLSSSRSVFASESTWASNCDIVAISLLRNLSCLHIM